MEFGPTFFVAVAFVAFIVMMITMTPVGKLITSGLDNRGARIKDELGEALRLKEEAQALLASYQRKQKEVVEESENILKEAAKEAERITKEAAKELDEALNKRVEIAMQKIASHEATVIQQVKNHSIDVAINTVRSLIVENLNHDLSEELVGQAMVDIGKKLH